MWKRVFSGGLGDEASDLHIPNRQVDANSFFAAQKRIRTGEALTLFTSPLQVQNPQPAQVRNSVSRNILPDNNYINRWLDTA
jgi:hypothetical protein